ncbi:DDE-domain-containing protein [Zopfia rhizophila CBS 207.26]|uniref:DDE-domain-containing protein n=1 Tax=Zopfia rhizophila CBS 207.26 TaxID=1314779 RepID=A0A6A6E4P7_9PEZI|nr:DDE-domain-containing protein [Zopfia rhizophila CBS 207.26]
MPPHSSHILQPLDVGYFSLLKTAYGRQVKKLMRNQFNHITKIEFLPAFRDTFNASITEKNIQESFQGTGLVLFDPDEVILKLDVQLRTPTPLTVQDTL